MALEAINSFTGLYGEMGTITVNLTTMPKQNFTLYYFG